jgi:hypothetical protein
MDDYPGNPFVDQINRNRNRVLELEFESPYLHILIYCGVSILLVVIFSVLYVIVGIPTQILRLLWDSAEDSFNDIENAENSIEVFSHAVAVGVFAILCIPFGLIVAPFAFIGWTTKLCREELQAKDKEYK